MKVALSLLVAHIMGAALCLPAQLGTGAGEAATQLPPITREGVLEGLRVVRSQAQRSERLRLMQRLVGHVEDRGVDFFLTEALANTLTGAGATTGLLAAIRNHGPDRKLFEEFRQSRQGGDPEGACRLATEYRRRFAGRHETRLREVTQHLASCVAPPTPTPTPEDDVMIRWERALVAGDQAVGDGTPMYAEAVAKYSEAKKLRPDNWWAFFRLGELYAKQEDFDRAIGEFKEALRLRPEQGREPAVYRALGIAYVREGLYKEGASALQRPGVLQAGDHVAYRHLALARFNLRQFNDAAYAYGKAIEYGGNDAQLYYELGNSQLALERTAEALQSYTRALGLDPTHVQAATQIATLRSTDPAAQYALGDVYLKLKKYRDAQTSFERGRALLSESAREQTPEPEGLWHAHAGLRAGGEVVKLLGVTRVSEESGYTLNVEDLRGQLSVCVSDIHDRSFEVFITKNDPQIRNCRQAPRVKGTRLSKAERVFDFVHNNRVYVFVMTRVRHSLGSSDYLEFMLFRKVS